MRSTGRADEHLWLAAVAIVACGIALRCQQLALGRSLWIDEAMLAYGVVSSGGPVVGELPYGQVAPPGFLLATRAVVAMAGLGEMQLRLPALFAGCAALVASACLARRVSGNVGAVISAMILAFSPAAVYYSQEYKPYAFDMLLATLIPLLGLRAWTAPEDGRRWTVLALVCAIGPAFSTIGVLVVTGVLLPLTLLGVRSLGRRQQWWQATGLTMALVTFCATYWTSYRFATHSDVMLQFWRGAYLDASSVDGLGKSVELVRRLVWGQFIGPPPRYVWWVSTPLVEQIVFGGLAVAVVACATIGASVLVKNQKLAVLLALGGGPLALVGASLAGQYPTAARLALFALAPVVVLTSVAAAGTRERPSGALAQASGIASAGMLVALALPLDLRWRLSDAQWSDAESMVETALSSRLPIYINARGVPQLLYYAASQGSLDSAVNASLYSLSRFGGSAFENNASCAVGGSQVAFGAQNLRTLIVGAPTGMRFEYMAGWNQYAPCPEWAGAEASRISRVTSDVLLLFLHHIGLEGGVLISKLTASGWSCKTVVRNYDELLVRCRR